jgi:hypothetical protein
MGALDELDHLVPPEVLPCPKCHHVTEAPTTADRTEEVRCGGCGKLLRRRPQLTDMQRAQALAWRWAAAQFAQDSSIRYYQRHRKLRGDSTEGYGMAMLRASEMLLAWARTVHRRPPLHEIRSRPNETDQNREG